MQYTPAKDGVRHMKQYVVFRLEQQEFAIPIEMAREIIRLPALTPLPGMPEGMLGIANLRGTVVPAWDLHVHFGGSALVRTQESQLLVLQTGSGAIGIVVDDVTEVSDFDESELTMLPPTGSDSRVTSPEQIIMREDRLILVLGDNRFAALSA